MSGTQGVDIDQLFARLEALLGGTAYYVYQAPPGILQSELDYYMKNHLVRSTRFSGRLREDFAVGAPGRLSLVICLDGGDIEGLRGEYMSLKEEPVSLPVTTCLVARCRWGRYPSSEFCSRHRLALACATPCELATLRAEALAEEGRVRQSWLRGLEAFLGDPIPETFRVEAYGDDWVCEVVLTLEAVRHEADV